MNSHSTPIQGKRPDKRDLSTSSIVVGNKKNKLSDSVNMQSSDNETTNHFHLSEADIDGISKKLHDLLKSDIESIVSSVVQYKEVKHSHRRL
ncbi:hypothetical protein DPMN_055930 [Dreissena polymorpha]|uniref:Uncharacterized protein n=1 Tax=Dreissena polymorpha TaxID=45954 RepID=A0A9D4CSP5_DREPO|nr:hypothetical protein DPMN_055930 [Dreissena polymorpha]